MNTRVTAAVLLAVGWCTAAGAQTPSAPQPAASVPIVMPQAAAQAPGATPFIGSVPSGPATTNTIPVSLKDAVDRALKYNLGIITGQQDVETARGQHIGSLSGLLPSVSGTVGESLQTTNLQAFGFPSFPGIPQVLGPFSVFDARIAVSQSLVNIPALQHLREAAHRLSASRDDFRNTRDLVVLVVANLYLRTVAASSRIDAAKAERDTAQALAKLATDRHNAGLSARIDELRAQVQLQVEEQRLIVAQNDFDKLKLQLARAIGLPVAQPYTLTDTIAYQPLQPPSLDDALTIAYQSRGDYLASEERVQAAQAAKAAASGERLPSLQLNANYGDIGLTVGGARETFTVAGVVAIPLFAGGRIRSAVIEAQSTLERRRAELANLKNQIDYDVRTAFLDLKAADDQLKVAQGALNLANEELQQARDRFSAGVGDNVEVIQAQESVATANDSYISSLYAHNVAKASLARALGVGEQAVERYLGGSR
ncbi:MAG TPA: TolC family protein [Vicinamibacterales bacterium]|jgi:outer membrane protein TolC